MDYRFSGHETFPCRYAWLPKAYVAIQQNDRIFSDENAAMVALGIGKNMVRACRFWVVVTGVARFDRGRYVITDFGRLLLDPQTGSDPYLEDIRTLWLIHWRLCSVAEQPLFAWEFLVNKWDHADLTRTAVLAAFEQETERLDRDLSKVTLEQHFDTFLHTYVPTRSRKGEVLEDNLDCPLVELEFVQKCGERKVDESGRHEPIYSFRRDSKPEISSDLFIYCLDDFWRRTAAAEATLRFTDIAISCGSPGQIFKLPEWDVRDRLGRLYEDSNGCFRFQESAAESLVHRILDTEPMTLLSEVYSQQEQYA